MQWNRFFILENIYFSVDFFIRYYSLINLSDQKFFQ